MPNVKISEKGKALLRNRYAALKVSKALAAKGKELYSKKGVMVDIDGKQIIIRGVSSSSSKEIKPIVAK